VYQCTYAVTAIVKTHISCITSLAEYHALLTDEDEDDEVGMDIDAPTVLHSDWLPIVPEDDFPLTITPDSGQLRQVH